MKNARRITVILGFCLYFTGSAFAGSEASQNNAVAALDIHGDRAAWSGVKAYPADSGKEEGIGQFDVDWHRVSVAHGRDLQTLFIRYELNVAADFAAYPAFFNLFIDADNNRATGYTGSDNQLTIGADYLIQGPNVFAFAGGPQTAFNWAQRGAAQSDVKEANRDIALAIPMELIGKPAAFRFVLLGDNVLSGHTPDYYPDSADKGEPGGFFEYSTSTESAE